MGLGNMAIGVVDGILMADIAGQTRSAETIIPKQDHDLVASPFFLGRDDDVEGSGKELETRHMTVLMREPTEAGASARWLVHPKDANGVMVEAVKRL